VLNVSRSGYYEWLSRPDSPRTQENELLLRQIRGSLRRSLVRRRPLLFRTFPPTQMADVRTTPHAATRRRSDLESMEQ
jgi:hypothetical protein